MATTLERPAVGSQDIPATDILGVQINAIDMATAVATIERWVETRDPNYVCIFTVHGIMECQRDPVLLEACNNAGLRTPDGMPLVWLSRRAGHDNVTRVYGPDLMLQLCARSQETKHRHFFYGGAPGVADELARSMMKRYPKMQIAGTHSPPVLPVGALEDKETIEKINASGADIVWVGLGTPKQDWWVANHRPLLKAPVLIAVGAAFDFHTGRVRQAPKWMQRNGLEWLFRLSQDPKRLWRRYIILNSEFVGRLVRHKFRALSG